MSKGDVVSVSGIGGRILLEKDGTAIVNIKKWTVRGISLGKISRQALCRIKKGLRYVL